MRRTFIIALLCVFSSCEGAVHPSDDVPPAAKASSALVSDWNSLTAVPAAPDGKNLHPEASANAALAQMMRSFYGSNPAHAASIDSLENALLQTFPSGRNTTWQSQSVAYGKQVAEAEVAWANSDGSNQAEAPYTPPTGPGLWQSTPPAHATLPAAAAYALTDALGDQITFTDHTYDDIGMSPRNFPNFEAAGREAGPSRLYGGIHYGLSIDAGLPLGNGLPSM